MARGAYHLRLMEGLRREVGILSLSGPTAHLAFRTSLSCVLAMLLAMALHLEDPAWAGITGLAIIQKDFAASLSRSIDRCLGTIAGAAVGYFGAHFVADHLIFQFICAGASIFGLYGMERSTHGYAALLGAVTVILVMFGALGNPEGALNVAVYRALEIMVGVGVAFAVDALFAPDRIRKPAPKKPGIFTTPVDQPLLVVAVTGGIAVALIPVIWESLQLPGLGQTPVTAFVIMVSLQREPAWTAVNRVSGCILGGLYGLACMHVVDDNIIAWVLMLFLGLYVSCHVKHGSGDAAYSGHQAGIAVIMAMVQGLAPSPDILPAIDRLVGIIGGLVVVLVAQALLTPLVARILPRLLGAGTRAPPPAP